MPTHDQLHSFFNTGVNCDESVFRPNIATAVSLSLEDSEYLREPLLGSPVEQFSDFQKISDQRDSSYSQNIETWQTKSVKTWSPQDILQWINSEARSLDVCCTEIAGEKFAQYDGLQLLSFSKVTFTEIDNNYGPVLYQRLRDIALNSNPVHYQQLNDAKSIRYESEETMNEKDQSDSIFMDSISMRDEPIFRQECLSPRIGKKHLESSDLIEDFSPPPAPKKKGPGRPRGSKRKKKPERLGRLWEFLRDLLKNREYCPSLIVWDNYEEGMFRFVHSDKVARLWGDKKSNPDMNYEKLSRAMRYYYKSKVLLPVYGRRLVYKFGPNASGWRVDNPNFKDL